MHFTTLVVASILGASDSQRAALAVRGCYLLAGDFRSVSHHGPLLLIGGNLNVVTVASIVTVPE